MTIVKPPYLYTVYPLQRDDFAVGSTHDQCPGHITLSPPMEIPSQAHADEFLLELGKLCARVQPFDAFVVGKGDFGEHGEIKAAHIQDTLLLHLGVIALAMGLGFDKFDKRWAFMGYKPHSVALAAIPNPPPSLSIDTIAVMEKYPNSPHTVSGLYSLGCESNLPK